MVPPIFRIWTSQLQSLQICDHPILPTPSRLHYPKEVQEMHDHNR